MKKTYYTNIEKKKLCNRNNGELKTLPRFDFQMEDYFSVIFVDSLNKIIEIDTTDQFYIAGGLDVMKNSENLLFYSEDFTLENNRLTFTIDTYTDNYLKHIKNTNTPIYLEIGIINEKKTILLQDIVLAEPRVYLDGVAPTNIEVYYTKAQIDEKLAAVKVEQTDPIYTADKPTLALKSELFSKSYNDLTDKPTNVQELGITITTDDIISNYGAGDNLTNELANIQQNMWMNVEQQFNNRNYVKTINDVSPDENGSITITSDDIVSMYSGNEYSITEELQYIEETTTNNLIDYVNEQNYIKTIDGTQADDEGNFDLANFGYISVNNIGGYTGFKNIQEITAGEYIQVYDFNSLAAAYYITNIEQNVALFPEFNFTGLTEKQIKTIQVWIKNEVTLSVLELPDNYTVIDPDNFPTELQEGTTSVFVIRLYYNGSQLNTIINYAYSFTEV